MIGSYQLGDLMSFVRPYYGVNKQTGLPRKLIMKPQTYVADFGDLAAGTQTVRTIRIQANADFVLLGFAQDNADASSLQDTQILITDNSSGENFMNGFVYLPNYLRDVSAGTVDHVLPVPKMLFGNGSLSLLVKTITDAANNLVISAIGAQVYALD